MNGQKTRYSRRQFLGMAGASVATLAALPAHASRSPRPVPVSHSAPDPLDIKIGQMLLVGFRGLDLNNNPIVADLQQRYLGGVVLFSYDVPSGNTVARNIKSPEQLEALDRDLLAAARVPPLLISVDQEGGIINRLSPAYGFPPSYSQEYLGKVNDWAFTYQCAQNTAQTLKDMHINLNLAPVVDLLIKRNNVIGKYERSFSRYPDVVTAHASQVIRAHHDLGVLTTLKHFPGHGSAKGDTHAGFVDVTREWSRVELEPFRNIIQDKLADVVMTAHLFNARVDPDYPATLSRATLTDLLREELGWDGVIITDDMGMGAIADNYGLEQAIKLAVEAGVDILAFANNSPGAFDPALPEKAFTILKGLVTSGAVLETRIDESIRRITQLKARIV